MFKFNGINFENFSLKSLVGSFYKKEENHNEKITTVDVKKTEVTGDQIAHQQIEKQLIINLPSGTRQEDSIALLKSVFKDEEKPPELISADATEGIALPVSTANSAAGEFLAERFKEYQLDNTLLLDRGGLLYIYRERSKIVFSEEQLIFLVQSSIQSNFPTWFWAFYYRQKFDNVVPLLQSTFAHPSLKIRKGVITLLSNFFETGEDIRSLAETEKHPSILAFIILTLLEKDQTDLAQRVLANSLSRKIIPTFTEKESIKLEKKVIELGPAEKRLLHSRIENGWPEEKIHALFILSISADEKDLPALELLLERATYSTVTQLVLKCIKRVGKTTKGKEIYKEITDTRSIETFLEGLDALASAKYKPIFSKLLVWLRDEDIIINRVWGEVDRSKVASRLRKAVSELLDPETYELMVQYILSKFEPDEHGNLMSWRHFWVLREAKYSPEVLTLIKSETRLNQFDGWKDVIAELSLKEKVSAESEQELMESLDVKHYRDNLQILRKIYGITSPAEILAKVGPFITKLRTDLEERLVRFITEDHVEELKDIAKNDLEKFLGENRGFYRLYRKTRARRSQDSEENKDDVFEKLSEDIDQYNYIEKEYLAHLFKAKSPESNSILLESIGRPFDSIYESLEKTSGDTAIIETSLVKVVEENPNPLIKLEAIKALHRMGMMNESYLRGKTLGLLLDARDKVKASRGLSKNLDGDDWYTYELIYLWSINALEEFGNTKDFIFVQEAINRERVVYRSYHGYSYFFSEEVLEELLMLTENLDEETDKENAVRALNLLDYNWTKKLLEIEA